MKKVIIIDFSGKAPEYNRCLELALKSIEKNYLITYKSPTSDKILKRLNNLKYRKIFISLYAIFFLIYSALNKSVKIVHFQWYIFESIQLDNYILIFLKLFKKKIISTVHNLLPHDSGLKYLSFYRKIYEKSDFIIVHDKVTNKLLTENFKIDYRKIQKINHGIDLKIQRNFNNEKKIKGEYLLIFGHIKPYKGVEDFLRKIWSNIDQKKNRLVIAGKFDKKIYYNVKKIIKEYDLLNIVIIDEYVSEKSLTKLIMNAKAIIFPYKQITTSGALLKAISNKKICIARSTPLFENYKKTYFFPQTYKNNKQFVELINNIHPDYLADFLNNFEKFKANFSWSTVSLKHNSLYEKTIGINNNTNL